ncbi:MAG TPA: DinB family protein [Actinomycetes bacterium]|nr:DinB family protein [Actinomycetes bacterium]
MKEIVLEAFRHNAWATKELLAACRGLPPEQLSLPGTAAGTDRDILAIFNHLIQTDRGYVQRRGERPDWVDNEEDTADLDELERRAGENAEVWERFLAQPLEATKLIILDQGAYEAEQSVLVVQALHHGNAHREQISAILTGLGVEPPDLQAWSYAQATGHARERSPTTERS